MPYVQYWTHNFQGPSGQWYIEKCLTTLKKKDPCVEHTGKLFKTGLESDKDIGRKRSRNLHFVSNVYVVKDPESPENEGKVFLFKFGKKIFEKIHLANNPPAAEGKSAIDPFDPWDGGANFRLRIRKTGSGKHKQTNYDESSFDEASALFKDDKGDKKLEEVYKKEFKLFEFVDPTSFKSYEELKERLNEVLGEDDAPVRKVSKPVVEEEGESTPPWEESKETKEESEDDFDFASLDD